MRFGDLTYREIRERAEAGWLAVVPTGCTEQQGPHLPVDFDTWFAETVCLTAARQAAEQHGVNALVLSAMPFGPTPEHRSYGSGYVHLPQEIHEAVVSSVLDSLAEQGFRRIVVWRGCGQHDLSDVVERFNAAHRGKSRAFQPSFPYHAIWCRIGDPTIPGGHADSFATSIALYLRPESVRVNQISDPQSKPVDWDDPNLDFARYSSTGIIGDPTHASAELGARLWHAVVEEVAWIFKEIAGTEPGRAFSDVQTGPFDRVRGWDIRCASRRTPLADTVKWTAGEPAPTQSLNLDWKGDRDEPIT